MIIDLDFEQIKNIEAEIPAEFMYKLYAHIYGATLWERIEQLTDYPKVTKTTAKEIIGIMQDKFPNNKQEVLFTWVNRGFSVNDELKDGEVSLAHYTVKKEEK